MQPACGRNRTHVVGFENHEQLRFAILLLFCIRWLYALRQADLTLEKIFNSI